MMDKNLLVFYKYNGKDYYRCNGEEGIFNNHCIDDFKEKLLLPIEIYFVGYSKNYVFNFLSKFVDNTTDISLLLTSKERKTYIANLKEKEKTIGVISIPYKCNMYGRVNNNNPYKYTQIDGKNILLEVTKDYAKSNDGNYYFIANELSSYEQKFFSDCYQELKVDYLYKLNDYNNKRTLKKRKIKVHKL